MSTNSGFSSTNSADSYGIPSGSPVSSNSPSFNSAPANAFSGAQDSYGVGQAQPLALNPRANTLQDVASNSIASSASSGYNRIERDSKSLDGPTAAAADAAAVAPAAAAADAANEVDSEVKAEDDEALLQRLIAEAAAVAAPVSNLVQSRTTDKVR